MASQDSGITFKRYETVPFALRASSMLGKLVSTIGKWGTLFLIPLVAITVWDVFQRKMLKFVGDTMLAQGWTDARDWMYGNFLDKLPFQSTLLQELEWTFHVCTFTLVLGYGYIYNRHVRVDLVREKLHYRKQAFIELLGVSLFMIPYCLIVGWFAIHYAYDAWVVSEQSASLVGLSHRWAIKSILVFGLFIAALAGFAVWLQVFFALFGPKEDKFPLFVIEHEEEKIAKREMLDNIDASFTDGSNEAKRGDSSKLMSRSIDEATLEHMADTKGQIAFTILGVVLMVVILILVAHTFNFWSWLI